MVVERSAQIATAAKSAARAWADAGLARRLAALIDAGAELSRRKEDLYQGLFADGLSRALAEFYGGWIVHQGKSELLRFYARSLVRWIPTGDGGGELLVRRPDGVVLLVTPANSPTINAATLFSLLLPGNGIVVRAPDNDQGLRFLAEDILGATLERHGFSRDLVTVVTGKSRQVMGELLPRPEIDTVVFFGNAVAGRAVAEQAHALGKKVVLELDGSDHMIVWKDADVAGAVESARHAFDFSTQPCPIPKHVLVHQDAWDRFVDAFLEILPDVSRTVEQDPDGGMLVPVARPDGYFAALSEVQELGQILSGGYRMRAGGEPDESGAYVAPTVVALEADDVTRQPLRCFQDEIFFPLIPVVRFSGADEEIARRMIRLVNDSPFGLRCSVWTRSKDAMARFAREIDQTGLLIFNDDHAQAPAYASPWGGPKRSGGPHGESHFFWEKTSRLQAIVMRRLDHEAVDRICGGLGFRLRDEGGTP